MDIPSFTDIQQKLSVFKNNLSLLASIIIVFAAMLLFIPTKVVSSMLKERVRSGSVLPGNRVKRESEGASSSEQWKVLEKRQKFYESDANQIALLSIRSTQRELLSYNIFPEPKDKSPLIFKGFGQEYQNGVDMMLGRLKANDCPTEAEIERELSKVSGSSGYRGRRSLSSYTPVGGRGGYGLQSPYAPRSGTLDDVRQTILDEICLSRAKTCMIYANPSAIAGYDFWGEYKYGVKQEDAVKECWYYQLGYWIIEDIFDTIGVMNSRASARSVLTAQVKRLVGVSFTMVALERSEKLRGSRSYRGRGRGRGRSRESEVDKPSYVFTATDGLTETCTGRFCNDDIDVVHFDVTVVVRMESILPFMKELCVAKRHKFKGFFGELASEQVFKHNQITVLESSFRSIDPRDPLHASYRYGEEAVVELDLVCEYIFNKKAYESIKPEAVKADKPSEEDTTQKGWR